MTNPSTLDKVLEVQLLNPRQAPADRRPRFEEALEEAPEQIKGLQQESKPWNTRKVRRVDLAAGDAANRHLGKMGEKWIVEVERQRLFGLGRDDLADKVVWASQSIGDGLGFDILSFNEQDDSERLIEVKTTGRGKDCPFYVTELERRCSAAEPEKFFLYRAFNFPRAPRLYVLRGSLADSCQLEPIQYRATIGK